MSGERCQRRKMMGRGAEGGCGTEEKTCPVSRAPSHSPPPASAGAAEELHAGKVVPVPAAVDFYVQARKVLTERSPYDAEEAAGRVTTLPVALATSYGRHLDGHRKHKKVHAEHGKKAAAATAPPSPAVSNLWVETEEYFRAVTLADIDLLVPKLPTLDDPCLRIPVLPSNHVVEGLNSTETGKVEEAKLDAIQATAAEECAGVGTSVAEESQPVSLEVTELQAEQAESVMQQAASAEVEETELVTLQDGEEGDTEQTQGDADTDDVGVDNSEDDGVAVPSDEVTGCKDGGSLNWLLGSKHRALLTSERPNKKRKLLGSDAGLDKLLKLPHLQGGVSARCDYCCFPVNTTEPRNMLCCSSCMTTVHQKCYGVCNVPDGAWLCFRCKNLKETGKPSDEDGNSHCLLCAKEGGALKPVGGNGCQDGKKAQFAHLFCSLWMPEVYVDNIESMEPIMNIEGVPETRKKLVCNLCKVKHGICVRCSNGACRTAFHPICAREAKHKMEIWGKVGCDNVELRVFCSRHSDEDTAPARHLENHDVASGLDSSIGNFGTTRFPANKLSELRLTRTIRDKSFSQQKITDVNDDGMAKVESRLGVDVLAARSEPDPTEPQENEDMETSDIGNDNDLPSFLTSIVILKKLVERGKVKIQDVASEIEVSPASLESALVGNVNVLSSGIQSKLIRWLLNSMHVGLPIKHVKNQSAYTVPDGKAAENDVADAFSDEDPLDSNALNVADFDSSDVIVKSLPPRRRTKSNIRILKESEKANPSTDADNREEVNGNKVGVPSVVSDGINELDGPGASISGQNLTENNEVSEKPLGDDLCKEELRVIKKPPDDKGNTSINGQSDITHQEASVDVDANQEKADAGLISGLADLKDEQSFSGSYVHSFIQGRLIGMEYDFVIEHKIAHDGPGEKALPSTKASIITNDSQCKPSHVAVFPRNNVLDASQNEAKIKGIFESLAKAKGMGIIEFSPGDELEGEILSLQTRLLDTSATIKYLYGDLIVKVSSRIPGEQDKLKKQIWDMVLVNQFLREVKEAKKRGRKERRHREAQAILAAATAASASSRAASLRKDTNHEALYAHNEGNQKVDAASNSETFSPRQRAKEKPSKPAVLKASSGKSSDNDVILCDVCRRAETLMNPIFVCGSCKVAVHLNCYRRGRDRISSWYCEACEASRSDSSPGCPPSDSRGKPGFVHQCGLCGTTTGAFRKSTDGQWVHAFCAEWILGSTFRRGQEHPVEGMDATLKLKDKQSCCICHRTIGVCLKCCYGHCQAAFHPICARSSGMYMNVKAISGNIQHKAYCKKHSQEQRDKADFQYGAEELKSIRQIRVELEKLRLLCERIIKREKLKRELVICSHDILDSRRNYVSMSALAHSSFFSSGISSESATTSINNTSYSETVERSDDVTVDSTLSGKRKAVLPLHIKVDRTGEMPRSHFPLMRKLTDRAPFSGKQLPQRPMFIDKAVNDEKRSKPRKHTETFQKELLMTSDQASVQNQRLPKGFAYVPMDCLSMSQDTDEPHKPDG